MKRPLQRRPNWLLYVLLVGIAVAVIVLIVRNETGNTFGLANDDFARLTLLGAVLLFVGAGFLGRSLRPGEILRGFAFWFMMIVALAGVYTNRDNLVGVAGRLLGAIAPGVPVSGRITGEANPDSVVVVRASDGHFAIRATVDGTSLPLLFDTGASFVTLTYSDAAADRRRSGRPRFPRADPHRQRDDEGRLAGHRPARHRRHRAARREGAGGAARGARAEPPRHELPRFARRLRHFRRPAASAALTPRPRPAPMPRSGWR